MPRIGLIILFILLGCQQGFSQTLIQDFDWRPTKEQFDPEQWPYPLLPEIAKRFDELARKYPKLCRVHNIGKSVGGHDLLVLEITNSETGAGESKPGLWLDGNLHNTEMPGRQYLRYFVEKLLDTYGKDAQATHLVDTRTFYVMPVLNPDDNDRILSSHPAWPGHRSEQHPGKDLNGDGYITQMRIKNWQGPKSSRYSFEDEIDPSSGEYTYFVEGVDPNTWERGEFDRRPEPDGEREPTDFNRNWSGGWRSDEPGAGPFPFSQPELYAVAKFIADHKSIFFHYTIHTGGGPKSYLVRPPMSHPFQTMHHEDNDFYVRLGAVWADYSQGGIIENTYYSYQFSAGKLDHEGNQLGYIVGMAGFSADWAYSHMGLFSLTPEISGIGIDYNKDGYLTRGEAQRWHREEKGNAFFRPWQKFDHPEYGEIEIGGSIGFPQIYGDMLLFYSEAQYKLLLYIASLSPEVKVREVKTKELKGGKHAVTAVIQNTGWLSTYITQNAIKVRKDFPVVVELSLEGGELVSGKPAQVIGHIPGKLAYLGEWSGSPGFGRQEFELDLSMKQIEWVVKGSPKMTVTAWSHKGGRDRKEVVIR